MILVPTMAAPGLLRTVYLTIRSRHDLPERDLRLSPGHPVLVGDHLVPIMCLINGTSIARMPVERVTYWHIELDTHDILLAEGLPAESFLDFGNRPWFGPDAEAHARANPDLVAPGHLAFAKQILPVSVDLHDRLGIWPIDSVNAWIRRAY